MLIITLSYDNEKKTGNWVPMGSSGTPQVNLLDAAEALSATCCYTSLVQTQCLPDLPPLRPSHLSNAELALY